MKCIKTGFQIGVLALALALLFSCGGKQEQADDVEMAVPAEEMMQADTEPSLPKQFQRPAYMIGEELQVDPESVVEEEITLRVGATIRSTTGPQPLWDILKRLAAMKGMNVSWESDVNQNVLVDVDINANDDFYKAVDNLLRQVDYFHEMQENTIVVKYKETKKYQVGMPFTKHLYETGAGGNVLGGNDAADNIEGTLKLDSKKNEYDFWKSLDENLNKILKVWETEEVTEIEGSVSETVRNPENFLVASKGTLIATDDADKREKDTEQLVSKSTRRRSGNENIYIIDKAIGMITVTAPRPVQEKVQDYLDSLKEHLYRQISIEAKIIEVELTEASSIGINWSEVLKNFSLSGTIEFGSNLLGMNGQIWPYIFSDDDNAKKRYDTDGNGKNDAYSNSYDPTRFVSRVTMDSKGWSAFLNALNEQGQAKVLSSPKISLLNGQGALITVGRNVTYIESVEAELAKDSKVPAYTVNTNDILSGIGMAITATIAEDDEIIMDLVPVTTELTEPIQYKAVGSTGAVVGLPIVNIREMSTVVKVKDGEMLVIGGLITEDNDEKGEFLPILGEIPIVRYLFGHEKKVKIKRELIVLLKPVIL